MKLTSWFKNRHRNTNGLRKLKEARLGPSGASRPHGHDVKLSIEFTHLGAAENSMDPEAEKLRMDFSLEEAQMLKEKLDRMIEDQRQWRRDFIKEMGLDPDRTGIWMENDEYVVALKLSSAAAVARSNVAGKTFRASTLKQALQNAKAALDGPKDVQVGHA